MALIYKEPMSQSAVVP